MLKSSASRTRKILRKKALLSASLASLFICLPDRQAHAENPRDTTVRLGDNGCSRNKKDQNENDDDDAQITLIASGFTNEFSGIEGRNGNLSFYSSFCSQNPFSDYRIRPTLSGFYSRNENDANFRSNAFRVDLGLSQEFNFGNENAFYISPQFGVAYDFDSSNNTNLSFIPSLVLSVAIPVKSTEREGSIHKDEFGGFAIGSLSLRRPNDFSTPEPPADTDTLNLGLNVFYDKVVYSENGDAILRAKPSFEVLAINQDAEPNRIFSFKMQIRDVSESSFRWGFEGTISHGNGDYSALGLAIFRRFSI